MSQVPNKPIDSFNPVTISQEEWFKALAISDNPLNTKLAELVNQIKWPQEVVMLYGQLANILERKAAKMFPKYTVRAVLFGSLVNGLSIKGSDADVSLVFHPDLPRPPAQLMKLLRRTIFQMSEIFSKCVCIFSARVPVMKLTHVWGLEMDVSFNNTALARYNSELIKFYSSLDSSIANVMALIKLWIKVHSKKGNQLMSSYAASLLVLFSLESQKLVPTIHRLQILHGQPRVVDGWDSSYFSNAHEVRPASPLSTINLLYDFFHLFATFEFSCYIISVFTGEKIFKPHWGNPREEYATYDKSEKKLDVNALAVVQDPFDHSYNTTKNVNRANLIKFQNQSKRAAEVCQKAINGECENFLTELFDSEEKGEGKRAHPESLTKELIIYMGPKLPGAATEENFRAVWNEKVVTALKEVLQRNVGCEILEETADSKLHCKLKFLSVTKKVRSEIANKLTIPIETTYFRRNEMICEAICALDSSTLKTAVPFIVHYQLMYPPTRLAVGILTKNRDETSVTLNNFLKSTLVRSVESYLEETYDQRLDNQLSIVDKPQQQMPNEESKNCECEPLDLVSH